MMQQDVTTQSPRSRDEELALKNKRTGLAIFQGSWILAFVSLIVVNLQLRYQQASWPPPEVEALTPLLPTIATAGLIISGFVARRGSQAMSQDEYATFKRTWLMTLVLGVAFIAIMVFEWLSIGGDTQYGAVFRVMTAFHGFHALVIGGLMVRVYRRGLAGYYHSGEFWMVEATAKLWYFVVVAWLLFYVVLYWI